MKQLIHVMVSPGECNQHGTVAMLIDLTKDFLEHQRKRIEQLMKLKKDDSNLVYMQYWGGYFPVMDMSDIDTEWSDTFSDEYDNGGMYVPSAGQIKEFEVVASDNAIRLDAIQTVIVDDGFFIRAYGKYNDMTYETEQISTMEIQKLLDEIE